jgi:hypothetical protein
MLLQQKIVLFIPTSFLYRSGYLKKILISPKRKKLKKKKYFLLKKTKIMYLKIFLLKHYLERIFFFFFFLKLKIYFLDINNVLKKSFLFQKNLANLVNSRSFNYYLQKDFIFKKLLFMANAAYYFNDPHLLIRQLSERLTKIRKHKYAISQYFKALYAALPINPTILGVSVLICGKINGKRRTKSRKLFLGKPKAVQTIGNHVSYAYTNVPSYTGAFGLHVWYVY